MAITFPAERRDLSELTPAQLDALYTEVEILRDRLADHLEFAELAQLRRSIERTQAAIYARLWPPYLAHLADPVVGRTTHEFHCTMLVRGGPGRSDEPVQCRALVRVSITGHLSDPDDQRTAATKVAEVSGWSFSTDVFGNVNRCPDHHQ